MHKVIFSFNIIYISIIFFSALPMHGMEKENLCEPLSVEESDYVDHFLALPGEILPGMQSLEDSVKFFMKLSTIHKKWHALLTYEEIGHLCKYYSQDDKNRDLVCTSNFLITHGYTSKRLTLLTLICAGANTIGRMLLERAVIQNDVQCAEMIFKYYENPKASIKVLRDGPIHSDKKFNIFPIICSIEIAYIPLLFAVKSVDMAKIFIAHGANMHETMYDETSTIVQNTDYQNTNVLWHIMDNSYPSSLMEFYLARQVDTTKLCVSYKGNLLHKFAATPYSGNISSLDNFIQKAKLLLTTLPAQINALNQRDQTPLNIVKKSLRALKKSKNVAAKLAFKVLIELFQEHGGFVAEDLNRLANSKWMSQQSSM